MRRVNKVRTTVADPTARRAPELVDRQFGVDAPNRLLVADFTSVRLVTGVFVYTAFVVDAYAGPILGWACSTVKQPSFAQSAIRQAAALRAREGHPLLGSTIHHTDAGSQYMSVHCGDTIVLAGMKPSIGTADNAYDNALAKTIIGLHKTEAVRKDTPFRTWLLRCVHDIEYLTADWVHRYHTSRLMHRLG